jgi:hypothetical protein
LIPVACGEIRTDLIAANRLQWFAEARRLHAAGTTWWQFPAYIATAQEARQQIDPWEDTLRGYMLDGRVSGEDGQGRIDWPKDSITSREIMAEWLRLSPHQQGQASSTRLGRVMRRLGYEPVRLGHAGERGWRPIADTAEEPITQVSA